MLGEVFPSNREFARTGSEKIDAMLDSWRAMGLKAPAMKQLLMQHWGRWVQRSMASAVAMANSGSPSAAAAVAFRATTEGAFVELARARFQSLDEKHPQTFDAAEPEQIAVELAFWKTVSEDIRRRCTRPIWKNPTVNSRHSRTCAWTNS